MISLCVIAKNEAHSIGEMLTSVRGLVSESIVVDTGSTDGTQEIATRHGARVIESAWPGDFAAARNVSLAHAKAPWIFVLDADERLDAASVATIHDAVRGERRGFFIERHHFVPALHEPLARSLSTDHPARALGAEGFFVTRDLRLFPNDDRVRFVGAVHESVEDALFVAGFPSDRLEATIAHLGPLISRRPIGEKLALYLALAERKARENPRDWRNWFHFAAELQTSGRHREAIETYQRAIALYAEYAPAWRQLSISLCALDEYGEALEALQRALHIEPGCVLSWNVMGSLLARLGHEQEATRCFETALSIDQANQTARMNLGLSK